MTARLIISCNGVRPDYECRGFFVATDLRLPWALMQAREAGWSLHPTGGDLCQSCTRSRRTGA